MLVKHGNRVRDERDEYPWDDKPLRYSPRGHVELVLSNRLSVIQRDTSAHARLAANMAARIEGSNVRDMKRLRPYFLTFFSWQSVHPTGPPPIFS
jgi:hypothetical protein